MDKTLVGVLAAIGAIVPMAGAQAAVTPADVERAMNAGSFAELLQSVPNAPAILKAAGEQRAATKGDEVQVALPEGETRSSSSHSKAEGEKIEEERFQ